MVVQPVLYLPDLRLLQWNNLTARAPLPTMSCPPVPILCLLLFPQLHDPPSSAHPHPLPISVLRTLALKSPLPLLLQVLAPRKREPAVPSLLFQALVPCPQDCLAHPHLRHRPQSLLLKPHQYQSRLLRNWPRKKASMRVTTIPTLRRVSSVKMLSSLTTET